MALSGPLTDGQPHRDLFVGQALCDKIHDLALSRGEEAAARTLGNGMHLRDRQIARLAPLDESRQVPGRLGSSKELKNDSEILFGCVTVPGCGTIEKKLDQPQPREGAGIPEVLVGHVELR